MCVYVYVCVCSYGTYVNFVEVASESSIKSASYSSSSSSPIFDRSDIFCIVRFSILLRKTLELCVYTSSAASSTKLGTCSRLINLSWSGGEGIFFFSGLRRCATGIAQAVCTTLRFFFFLHTKHWSSLQLLVRHFRRCQRKKKYIVRFITILLEPTGSCFKRKKETVNVYSGYGWSKK